MKKIAMLVVCVALFCGVVMVNGDVSASSDDYDTAPFDWSTKPNEFD